MRIGILTFHYAHNYGAMLQAYALSHFLNQHGFDAEIIDYRLHYIYRNHERYNILGYYKWLHETNTFFISILKTLKSYHKHRNKSLQWYRFEDFLNLRLRKSNRIYNVQEIKCYDYIICGSDQIWNTQLTGGSNNPYWGNGIAPQIPMISYAASSGGSNIDIPIEQLKNKLKRFNDISVREKTLCDWLNGLEIKSECSIDPVFLLSSKEWQKLGACEQNNTNRFLLIYAFQEDLTIYKIADKIARQLKLKIVRLCYKKRTDLADVCDSCFQDDCCGPQDFIKYFVNASFVCTTSFHGVAFSILLNKQFYSISPKKYSERVSSVLNKFGLGGRAINGIEDVNLKDQIDYANINKLISDEVKLSFEYLKSCLK